MPSGVKQTSANGRRPQSPLWPSLIRAALGASRSRLLSLSCADHPARVLRSASAKREGGRAGELESWGTIGLDAPNGGGGGGGGGRRRRRGAAARPPGARRRRRRAGAGGARPG